MPEEFDLVVLGGGTGGYVAAIRAAQLGMRAAVVEREKLGGTCLHRGCIPSKALLRSAEVLALTREASDYGVQTSAPQFDLGAAMARKQNVVEQLHKGVQFLMKKHNIEVVHGIGRLMGSSIFSPQAGAVSVESAAGESTILSPRFTLVATGSRPKALPGLPFDGVRVLSSDHALELDHVPASVVIVGGGAIGVEWASMLADFGASVTVVEFMPRLLPTEDEDISRALERAFKKRHIRVMTGAQVQPETLQQTDDGVRLQVRTQNGEEALEAEVVLVAVGREPVVDDIGIEATEVKLERGAIVVDAHYRTAEKSIFAIGDVIGGMQLAHVAAHEGIHAVEYMAELNPRPLVYEQIARCTYSRPEVASVGLTEQQAADRGVKLKAGTFSFRSIGKALVLGDADGMVKVVADAETDDVLGVHIIGPHATDLISEAGLALVLNAAPWEVGQMVHPHPTLSEAIGEAALAVDGNAIHGA
ncbi:dihydrolipoyl dehydrogenase [Alicyclobacillus cycloheptanicus]|uniref:Dihydrolipoyl dehydrogenase n=1 Tax=Alicyclobacillus cycloheptanicus TaxID=1457 RepID=A0ABT9XDP7_9BACL|nr:dihydrolipoyl dehydrogenase [Alicyclobacillus cycloheptanicus]MDQ0188413.1 dihydrolipoamide dehydrogenase [Alicyclobacillus cycloheptanicus]WDM01117.1 dihydrolipoyl dehydrogenase [Alicyclobacillus cycloheptanicus]